MTSVFISKVQPHLSEADDDLFQLTAVLDSCGPAELSRISTLSRLKTNLAAAISAYELAIEVHSPSDVVLMKQADLLWQRNQCDYYLSHRDAIAAPSRPSKNRGLWQIRAVIVAVTHFKLLTYLRRALPGANIVSLSWRDILPGFRLWLMRFKSS